MRNASTIAWGMLLGVMATVPVGCATIPSVKPSVDDVAEKRKPRQEEVMSNFERRRDTAQLQAAADRFRQGDAATAEAMLKKLVERNADYAPARLLLARVLVDRQDYAGAEQHLRQIVEKFPKEAAAHYELGLLLDDLQRTDEAVVSLAKAAELEPSNELYRLSHQAIASVGQPNRRAAPQPAVANSASRNLVPLPPR